MRTTREHTKILFLICFVIVYGASAKNNGKEVDLDGVKHHERAIFSTFETEDGDIFDCIDIRSQPSFDHPLMRNHSIQTEPSSYPIEVDGNSKLPDTEQESSISLVSCPSGTIPMWRSENYRSMVDLTEVTRKIYTRNNFQGDQQNISSLAGLSRGEDIYGTNVSISVYEPDVYGTQDKSGGLTTIISGYSFDRENPNAIGAGWFVWASSAGDRRARFHIFYTVGKIHCFDLQCPGFMHMNPNIPLGGTLSPVSKYNGTQANLHMFIYQDDKLNWWLLTGRDGIKVGYWPKELFGYLKAKGTVAYWGGIVEGPTIKYKPPPMGSGHPASEGYGKAAYVRNIQVVDRYRNIVIPLAREFDVTIENPKCYSVAFREREETGIYANWGGAGDCKF